MAHSHLIAAYWCTWGIQLGYLVWMAIKWQRQRAKLKPGIASER
jgi:hypothetical protein